MALKTETPDVANLDKARDEREKSRQIPPVIVKGPPDPFGLADAGGGDVVFFDAVLAFSYGFGVGSITLTTQQQLLDPSGVPFEQRRITALLKASLPALTHLKTAIEKIEQRANDEAEAAIAAMQRPAGLPH